MVEESSVAASNVRDGGWGWLVVLASFTLQFLTIGTMLTFGVLFVDLLDYFDESPATTSLIGSIQPCLLYLTGIVSGPLIQKFGWRTVTICGSVLSAVGFASSALANNIYVLFFTYGVLTGFGNGLMFITSLVVVQHYFEKRRAMATGLVVTGSGLGTLTFGLLTRILCDHLGWRWALVVEGGMMLLGVICGLIFKPLYHHHAEANENTVQDKHNDQKDVDQYEQADSLCCSSVSKLVDLTFFKNPVFVIFCSSLFLYCFGYNVSFTYTPKRAILLGVDPQSSSFLVSIIGIASAGSRLLVGKIADRSANIRFYLAGIMLTLSGVISIGIPIFNTYPRMVLYSVLFGSFTGCWASLLPVILVDLFGVDSIEHNMGIIYSVAAIPFLVSSPVAGLIYEGTGGDIDAPFIVMGSVAALGGVFYFTIKCGQRKSTDGYQSLDEDR